MTTVRAARADDLERLREIEVEAGRLFAEVGMDSVAEDPPPSFAALEASRREGLLWVAVDEEDRPVGYARARMVDDLGHLEQVSVTPTAGRRGAGTALVEQVCSWSAAMGHPAVTLSTFATVAWNAPFYGKLGFRILADDELTPGLRADRVHEAAVGLDTSARVFMRREARPPAG